MKNLTTQYEAEQPFTKKYYYLWQGIGVLGLLLPFLLVFFVLVFGKNAFPANNYVASISAIFYSNAGSLFVGTMFVVAFFLLNYSGFCKKENFSFVHVTKVPPKEFFYLNSKGRLVQYG